MSETMLSPRCAHPLLLCFLMLSLVAGCVGTPTPPLVPPATTPAPVSEEKPELEKFFQGYSGAFVLYALENNRYTRYAPGQCSERLRPASTFKILNALISLETGVAPDEDYVIKWDGTQYPIPSWNRDHTLKTAIQNSVVWYYQELARRVGKEKMQYYVELVNYGNEDISGKLDSFWLDGGLRISADEQVEFLKRLYLADLPFSQRTLSIVKDILVIEDTQIYRLSGKTGSGKMGVLNVGWFVGYVEEKGKVYFFATNITSSNSEADGPRAKEITREILQDLGLPVR